MAQGIKAFAIYLKADGSPGDGGAHGRKVYIRDNKGILTAEVSPGPGASLTVGEYIAHVTAMIQSGKYPRAVKPYAQGYRWARDNGAAPAILSKILAGILAVTEKNKDPAECKARDALLSEIGPVASAPAAMVPYTAPVKADRFQLIEIDTAPAPVAGEIAPVKCGFPCLHGSPGCPICRKRWIAEAAHAAKVAAEKALAPIQPGAHVPAGPVIETAPTGGADKVLGGEMGYLGADAPHVPIADRFSLIELD
jgi:hypothetical protein